MIKPFWIKLSFLIARTLSGAFCYLAPKTKLLSENFVINILCNHISYTIFKTVKVLASLEKKKIKLTFRDLANVCCQIVNL